MPVIVPIRDLKDTNGISELCKKTNEPIFVTKNGYGEMVIMSIETFDDMQGKLELYRQIAASEKDIAEGKLLDAHEASARIREKYGL